MCGILHWLYGILHGMQTVVLCIQACKDWMHAVFVAEYTANLCYRTFAHVHHSTVQDKVTPCLGLYCGVRVQRCRDDHHHLL